MTDEPPNDAELSKARAEEALCEESLRRAVVRARGVRTLEQWAELWPDVNAKIRFAEHTFASETERIEAIQRYEDCLRALPQTFAKEALRLHGLRTEAQNELARLLADPLAPASRLRALEEALSSTTAEWRHRILDAREQYRESLRQSVDSAHRELDEKIQGAIEAEVAPSRERLRLARGTREDVEERRRRDEERREQEAAEAERARVLAERARSDALRAEEASRIEARRALSFRAVNVLHRSSTGLLRWKRDKLSHLRHEHGVQFLLHLTHVNNLPSIARAGILPHSRVGAQKHVAIDNKDVQMRREARQVKTGPKIERCVHDMVPLFLVPLTPMLFACTQFMPNLAFIKVDLDYLAEDGVEVVFSDGNIAAKATETWYSLNFLDRIPWDVLRAERWTDCEDGKRRRAAEFLVFPDVQARAIRGIVVPSEAQAKALRRDTLDSRLIVEVQPEWFPGDWQFR